MQRTTLALILWTLTGFPPVGQAQNAGEAGGPRQFRFETLKDSQWVRVTSPGYGREQGQILEHNPTELVLSSDQRQPLRLRTTSIDTLWTRGTSVETGAIAGALIGGALGVGLGLLCGEAGDDCNTGEAVALFGGVGLGGGALLGTLVGLVVPRWKRQYP